MISITTAVLLSFSLAVLIVLYIVMKPLTDTEAIKTALKGLKPNFDFKGTRAHYLEERAKKG